MKKVLIITYYWPPAGGPGVQRILKFVKYLNQLGWQTLVLTVKEGDYPALDNNLASEVPENCKIFKTSIIEPYNIYRFITGKKKGEKLPTHLLNSNKNDSLPAKIAKWIRINLFIPDARIGWVPFIYKKGLEIIRNEKPDLIFSTSPPHSTQIGALKLAKKTGIKLVCDFRDPWMEIAHYQKIKRNVITSFLDRRLENRVLKNADHIVTISKNIVKMLSEKVNHNNFSYIPNGFDPDDFNQFNSRKNEFFTICYTGFLSKNRIPFALLEALKMFLIKFDEKKIKLQIVGTVCQEFKDQIQNYDLQEITDLVSYKPHNEAVRYLCDSDCALLIIDDIPNNKGFVTGKVFDYLGSKKPIFAIGPLDGDAAEIIKETNSGIMHNYDDNEKAFQTLIRLYDDWLENKSSFKFSNHLYSREIHTKQLSMLFNEMINQKVK